MLLALPPGGSEQKREQRGKRKGDDEAGGKEEERGEGCARAVRRERINGKAGAQETHAREDAQLHADGPAPLRRVHVLANVRGRVHDGYTRGRTFRARERSPAMSSRSSHWNISSDTPAAAHA